MCAQLSERNRTLKDYAVTEATLKELKRLGHEEATWRVAHELRVQIQWAKDRAAFIQSELDTLLPAKTRRVPKPEERPIQSHQHGAARNGKSPAMFGEKYG